jgi:hypothetical protein
VANKICWVGAFCWVGRKRGNKQFLSLGLIYIYTVPHIVRERPYWVVVTLGKMFVLHDLHTIQCCAFLQSCNKSWLMIRVSVICHGELITVLPTHRTYLRSNNYNPNLKMYLLLKERWVFVDVDCLLVPQCVSYWNSEHITDCITLSPGYASLHLRPIVKDGGSIWIRFTVCSHVAWLHWYLGGKRVSMLHHHYLLFRLCSGLFCFNCGHKSSL